MEAVEEAPHGAGLGQGKAQTSLQTIVACQQGHVLGAIPTGGLEQDHAFNVLGIRATALTLLQLQVGGDQIGNPQGPKGAGGCQEAGVGAGHFVERPGVNFKGRLMLSRYACGHAHNIDTVSMSYQQEKCTWKRFSSPFWKLTCGSGVNLTACIAADGGYTARR